MHRVNKPIPMTAVQTDLQIGKGQLLREGDDAVIFACGYMVADVLSAAETQARTGMKFKKVGIADTFAEGGTTAYLFDKYGLSSHHIVVAISVLLGRG